VHCDNNDMLTSVATSYYCSVIILYGTLHTDSPVVAEPEPEPPVDGSTGGVPGGTGGSELEVDERLLESASDGESGSDDLFKKDSSSEGEEEGEEERETSRVEDVDDGSVQEKVKKVSA